MKFSELSVGDKFRWYDDGISTAMKILIHLPDQTFAEVGYVYLTAHPDIEGRAFVRVDFDYEVELLE